jgi:hypothetical protein
MLQPLARTPNLKTGFMIASAAPIDWEAFMALWEYCNGLGKTSHFQITPSLVSSTCSKESGVPEFRSAQWLNMVRGFVAAIHSQPVISSH